jgi:hypothetical protein
VGVCVCVCVINAPNVDTFLGHLFGVKTAKSARRVGVLRTVLQLLAARGGRVSIRSCSELAYCYEELCHHRCKEFVCVCMCVRGQFKFFLDFLCYILRALDSLFTPKRAVLQEGMLSDNAMSFM